MELAGYGKDGDFEVDHFWIFAGADKREGEIVGVVEFGVVAIVVGAILKG